MSKDIKGDHKHLTLSDRIFIEHALVRGDNFRTIAKALCKDPSTISLEVRRFLEWDNGHHAREQGNDCAHFDTCEVEMLCLYQCAGSCKHCQYNKCNDLCSHYDPLICDDL